MQPSSIGEKIRNRRLELNLLQKEVALMFAVTEDSITNWENNASKPEIRYMPVIIEFLGYIPFEINQAEFAQRLLYFRIINGLTHKQMGKTLSVDASTIGSWEKGKHMPHGEKKRQIEKRLELILSRT